jgi:hypothetical protein
MLHRKYGCRLKRHFWQMCFVSLLQPELANVVSVVSLAYCNFLCDVISEYAWQQYLVFHQ